MNNLIFSQRKGFACNSSSTHSCVVLKESASLKGLRKAKNKQYGFEYFTIRDKQAIKEYFYLMLYRQVVKFSHTILYSQDNWSKSYEFIKKIEQLFAQELMPKEILETIKLNKYGESEGYVDHQSVRVFPSIERNLIPDFDFAEKLIEEIASIPNIAILGGNDNDDKTHKFKNHSEQFSHPLFDLLPYDEHSKPQWLRYDDNGFYTLFDPSNGNKARFTFDNNVVIKSSVPELVDLKITNYCTKGCKFCYQASTPQGIHAEYSDVQQIIVKLAKVGCFEIAIGGGEPTEHPDIISILKVAKENNIIANLTTKSQTWLQNPLKAKEIIELSGAIALSISSTNELGGFLDKITKLDNDYGIEGNFTVQLVLGTMNKDKLKMILNLCENHHLPVTLLGFKQVGFGEDYEVIPYLHWLEEVLLEHCHQKLSIDSKVLSECEQFLNKTFDNTYLTDKEGLFSCYIDAVEGYLAKDSYSNCSKYSLSEKRLEPVNFKNKSQASFYTTINANWIMDKFKEMQTEC